MQDIFSARTAATSVSVTSTASTSAALPGVGDVVRIVNEGPNICFVSIGTGSQTATLPSGTAAATCTAVLAGSDVIFSVPNPGTPATGSPTPLNISAICRASGTATLTVQVGTGL